MGRDSCARRPVIGWLLGALVAFCAVWPGTSGPVVSATAAAGPAALVRVNTLQHIEAVAAPLRPEVPRSTSHAIAATSAERPSSVPLAVSTALDELAADGDSTSLSLSAARAPPSVRA